MDVTILVGGQLGGSCLQISAGARGFGKVNDQTSSIAEVVGQGRRTVLTEACAKMPWNHETQREKQTNATE